MSQEEEDLKYRKAKLSDIDTCLKTPQGKKLLWEVLSYCDLYSVSGDDIETGKRTVGVDILNLLEEVDPSIYPKLVLENIKDE